MDRHGFRPGRGLAVRVDELGSAIDEMTEELRQLQDALRENVSPRVMNGSSGLLVIWSWRAIGRC